MGRRRKNLKKAVFRVLDLPEEADGNTIKVTMVGRNDLLVENHKGVLQYAVELVRLLSSDGVLRVEGAQLMLSEFGMGRAYIRGEIAGWRFEDGK